MDKKQLKEAFSKLEHKLDYGDETKLTDLEIASLLDYIGNLESNINNLQRRVVKAIIRLEYVIELLEKKDMFHIYESELLEILKGDNNG